MDYRRDIDGLRALAVLAVILCHAEFALFSGGFVGVDIFFVISGYLITGIIARELRDGSFSLAGFYERRVRRILPALFAMIAACMIGGWFLLPPPQYESLGRSAIATTFFVSNVYFQRTTGSYFASDAQLEPLLHTWSLGVEEQFYIVIPLLLILLFRGAPKLLVPAAVLGVAGSFALSVYATTFHPVANFYSLPTRAWELGLGALLVLGVAPAAPRKWVAEMLAIASVAMILLAIVAYDQTTAFPGLAAVPPVLGTAVLIWLHGNGQTMVGRVLSTRSMVGIGLISYSLYLWHWPLLLLARNYTFGFGIEPALASLAIAASFLCAWISFRYVEQPFRKRSPGQLSRAKIFGSAAFAAGSILALAAIIAVNAGFWTRAPESRAAYLAAMKLPAEAKACSQQMARMESEEAFCMVNPQAPASRPAFMLWGDSHARVLLPAYAEALEQRGLAGMAAFKPGCAPSLGISRPRGRATQGCDGFNRALLARARGSDEPLTIILIARWPFWATGVRPPGEAGGAAGLKAVDPAVLRYGERPAQMLEAGLEDLVGHLQADGHRVVILSGIPELGWNPPDKLLIADFAGTDFPDGPMLADVRRRQAQADAVLRRVRRKTGAKLIDSAGALCAERCPVRRENELLYRDDDHLSPAGATTLFAQIGDQIFEP